MTDHHAGETYVERYWRLLPALTSELDALQRKRQEMDEQQALVNRVKDQLSRIHIEITEGRGDHVAQR